MSKNKRLILVFGVIVLITSPSLAFAALKTFDDPATFVNQGTIVENYGYEDFPSSNFSYPGDSWTAHGVTYTTDGNLIVGSGTQYQPISNVFCNNFKTPITANIDNASEFSMLGFDLGSLEVNSSVSLAVYTNLNTYNFYNLSVPDASTGFKFYGAVADGGEFFTGFKIDSLSVSDSAPALDNVRLGKIVPEPISFLLFGLGGVTLGAVRRMRRKK
jgi:hypothetical protein